MMPDWTLPALMVVFGIHLLIFGCLAVLRRKAHHFGFALTFVLLILATAFRLWWPQAQWGEIPWATICQMGGWLATAFSIVFMIRAKLASKKAEKA